MVVHGQQRGRALGYPTANLSPQLEGFIPADGVYAGRLTVDGETMPAAISIGNNPTFEGVPERQVEAHVLDEDLDLYDRIVEVEFVDRIRGMAKFDSLDELIAQMGQDTLDVRGVLARANAAS
jgi:riboflavin kinase/FMN adenylyltransferase